MESRTMFVKAAAVTLFQVAAILGIHYASAAELRVPSQVPTVTQAIEAAVDGDTVLIEPGVYPQDDVVSFLGKAIEVRSTHGPEATELVWVDGTGGGVGFFDGEGFASRLQGLTLRGGGVRCLGSSPTIEGNRIIGGAGSGVRSNGTPPDSIGPRILSNLIEGWSTSDNGAGICVYTAALIQGNRVIGNTSYGDALTDGSGAGIFVDVSFSESVILVGNLISGNQAIGDFGRGGGVYLHGGQNTFSQNTIVGNFASFGGSGVVLDATTVVLENSIFWGNAATTSSPITSGASVSFCLVEGGWPGLGNIDADPLFVAGPLGEYYLSSSSPCIDAGNPATPFIEGTTVPDQLPDTGIVDMGFHYPLTPDFVRGDCNIDGVVDLSDPIFHLASLFVPGSSEPFCESACDGNSDGVADVSDAVFVLSWLFIGGPAPAAPFPDCGIDPAAAMSSTSCESFGACP